MDAPARAPPGNMLQGETQPACVWEVLDDDDLLAEIIVRVGSPTSLVRAAAVCRRWLRLASDRVFLRRFRKLHPPRLLGFYLGKGLYWSDALFIPMLPQPPPRDLAAILRRASLSEICRHPHGDMVGCWNGRVLTRRFRIVMHIDHNHTEIRKEIISVVQSPQRGTRAADIPTLRLPPVLEDDILCTYTQLFLKEEEEEEGGQQKALSYFYVEVLSSTRDDETKSTVHVYTLQNGDEAWHKGFTLVAECFVYAQSTPSSVLIDTKIYMASTLGEIIVLDLAASSFSTIQLPQGVDFGVRGTTMLSRAEEDASALYLIHAKEFQIHIWLHAEAGGNNWLLVDKICLREMCTAYLSEDVDTTALLRINHVGDYTGEYLFLEMSRWALYLDVKCRTLRKVYEIPEEDPCFRCIYPFTMIWPPIFPVLKDGHARFASCPFDDACSSALLEVT